MKSIVTFLCFLLLVFQGFGQINLVPNPSFEDTVSCPTGGSAIDLAVGWQAFRNSPDYFNSCNGSFVSIPSNFAGYAPAKDGNAYSGFICFYSYLQNSREFIGISLNQSTIPGQKYFASFYISLAYNIITSRMGIASNNLGIKMSTIPFTVSLPAPIDNSAQVYSNSIISDSTNWTKVSGSFIADSAYEYLMIGNFFTDSATTISVLDSNAIYSYYYVDQVVLSTDSLFANHLLETKNDLIPIISPNPSCNFVDISGKKLEEILIRDVIGKIVFRDNNILDWPYRIDVSNFRKGVYFLTSITENLSFCTRIIIY